MAQCLYFIIANYKIKTMKLFATYQKLKRKSLELLSKGFLDDYFETLMQIAKLEKQMQQLQYLN